jgi:tetratricopeptide (TPR) repeat protein
VTYNQIGQFDQAVAEAREAIRLMPKFFPSHRVLGFALLHLNRFIEAKDILAYAIQQNLDHVDFHYILYQIAFLDGDTVNMQKQIDWARGKTDEYAAFDWQTGAAASAGQWRKAQEFARSAIDLAARGDTNEVAARYATEQALLGAVFGNPGRARAAAAQGLALARGRASLPRAALALALSGETNQAQSLIDESIRLYPEDTVVNSIWLPAIRAAMELQRGSAEQAIALLIPAIRYEAAAEFWPVYLRGQAFLRLNKGAEAGAEFQKILEHRGQAALSPLYPLAHLGLARAAALTGEESKCRQEYQDFFVAWKDADADLPVLIAAKKEYDARK